MCGWSAHTPSQYLCAVSFHVCFWTGAKSVSAAAWTSALNAGSASAVSEASARRPATARRGTDQVVDCHAPQCAATPLQPELWTGLTSCETPGETFAPPYSLFGVPIKPVKGHKLEA